MNRLILGRSSHQATAHQPVSEHSLRMALCLNGTVPVRDLARAENPGQWLSDRLLAEHPDIHPGATGPITIVLVL